MAFKRPVWSLPTFDRPYKTSKADVAIDPKTAKEAARPRSTPQESFKKLYFKKLKLSKT